MKYWSFALFVLLSVAGHAAVFTLNNSNPSPGQYATFAAAQSAASTGDTILVHGSATVYANFAISKTLTVIGPGHKPQTLPGLAASVNAIDISANSVRIVGIKATAVTGNVGISGVTITNCFLNNVSIGANGNNWFISNNVFENAGVQAITLAGGSNATNLTVSNNIINSANVLGGFGGTGTKLFSNNVFTWSGAGVLMASGESARNVTFENNIFYGITPNAGIQTNCVYNRNLSYLTSNNALPPAGQTGSGNLINVNPLFVNVFTPPASSAFSYTRNYRLQTGSPALGAGTGGTHIGVYEPDFEFSMSGEPFRPQTNSVVTPSSVPLGGTIQTSFTIRKATTNAQ
jgi:hypothetical protein